MKVPKLSVHGLVVRAAALVACVFALGPDAVERKIQHWDIAQVDVVAIGVDKLSLVKFMQNIALENFIVLSRTARERAVDPHNQAGLDELPDLIADPGAVHLVREPVRVAGVSD